MMTVKSREYKYDCKKRKKDKKISCVYIINRHCCIPCDFTPSCAIFNIKPEWKLIFEEESSELKKERIYE